MFDRKDITAVEARSIMCGIDWNNFIDHKIEQCNTCILRAAKIGHREARLDIYTKEKYVWDKVTEHFQSKGFEVIREWSGIRIRW